MALADVVKEIVAYLKSENHNVDEVDEHVIKQIILRDCRRSDHEDDEWTMVYRFQRYAKDSPDLKYPEGYVLAGWLDYGGHVWPDRKFGVYPHFVHKGSQVSI